MGIVISALTGSENPSEVAVMAKQASEVSPHFNLKIVNLL